MEPSKDPRAEPVALSSPLKGGVRRNQDKATSLMATLFSVLSKGNPSEMLITPYPYWHSDSLIHEFTTPER